MAVELRFAADTTGFPACAAAGASIATVRTSGRANRRTAASSVRSRAAELPKVQLVQRQEKRRRLPQRRGRG